MSHYNLSEYGPFAKPILIDEGSADGFDPAMAAPNGHDAAPNGHEAGGPEPAAAQAKPEREYPQDNYRRYEALAVYGAAAKSANGAAP